MRRAVPLLALLIALFPALANADNLRVSGAAIHYGGEEVRLQGVAVGDPLLARRERPLSDYERIAKEWNANLVRISIHPGSWRDFGRREAMAQLSRDVDAAEKAGLFVIITWHAIGLPSGGYEKASGDYVFDLYDSDFALAKDFWRAVTQRFGEDGKVIFELWNEPEDASGAAKWADLKPKWEELTGLIRDSGGRNILLAAGLDHGYRLGELRDDLLADSNTAYAWHVYGGTDGNDEEKWNGQLRDLQQEKPVFVTEWGFEPDGPRQYRGTEEDYGRKFHSHFLRDKGLHHTAWVWNPTWTPSLIQDDWETPTEYGEFVKKALWEREGLVRP